MLPVFGAPSAVCPPKRKTREVTREPTTVVSAP
jgi:hypothetical protein